MAGLRKLARKTLPESGGDLGYGSSQVVHGGSRLTVN